jgi:predicted metalloendopeptidase
MWIKAASVLPDKSYYIDEKDAEKREKYVAHISRMFELDWHPST